MDLAPNRLIDTLAEKWKPEESRKRGDSSFKHLIRP